MRLLVALVIFTLSITLHAEEEGVLINPMYKGEIALLEKALVGRGWKIRERTDSQIRAEVENVGRGVAAELLFFYQDGGFNYKGSATKKIKRRGFGGNSPVTKYEPTDVPTKWFNALRGDVDKLRSLLDASQRAKMMAEPASKPEPGQSVESRLKSLQSLYDQQLITETEYQAKRQEILSDL